MCEKLGNGLMSNEKRVSVITVSFNSQDTIRDTIESVLNQSYSNIEYWIVDGLSKDHTVDIAREYADAFSDRGMEYHILSENDEGIYDAMNKGIARATGDIIGIINSDDWYECDAIEKVVRKFEESQCDVMYGDLRIHKTDGSMIKRARYRKYATTRDWNHPTTFISKTVYEDIKYKNHNIHDDWDLMLRVRKAGYKITVLNEVLANFRFGGISNHNSESICKKISNKYAAYKENGYSFFYWFDCAAVIIVKDMWKK